MSLKLFLKKVSLQLAWNLFTSITSVAQKINLNKNLTGSNHCLITRHFQSVTNNLKSILKDLPHNSLSTLMWKEKGPHLICSNFSLRPFHSFLPLSPSITLLKRKINSFSTVSMCVRNLNWGTIVEKPYRGENFFSKWQKVDLFTMTMHSHRIKPTFNNFVKFERVGNFSYR